MTKPLRSTLRRNKAKRNKAIANVAYGCAYTVMAVALGIMYVLCATHKLAVAGIF